VSRTLGASRCRPAAVPRSPEPPLASTLSDRPASDRPAPTPGEPTRRERRRTVTLRGHLGYQPALDGLRAFAVASVMLYHAGLHWVVGGYLGVDLFFVLSGFLITSLLVQEWAGNGRIDFKAFWIRRARRLLPALGVVMLGIVTYAAVFAAPGEVDTIRNDGLAALGYVANWRFIFSGQSYFAQFTQPSPLKHMWSLAIEEQFYLLWPLIVFGVLAIWRSIRVLVVACVAMILGSALLMAILYHPGQDPSRVYYGTDTRAQSLVMGALVGVLLLMHGPIRSRAGLLAVRTAAWVGAVYTVWLWWRMSERTDMLYRGGFLTASLAVIAIIASVTQPERGWLGAFLSLAPLRFVGRISYGLYLWHWPVYLTLTETRTGISGNALLFLRLGVTAAFALASFFLIEEPIRHKRLRLPRPAIVLPVAAVALVVALFVSTTGGGESIAATTQRALDRAAKAPPPTAPVTTAVAGAKATTAPAVPAGPFKTLILGDSVAASIGLGFDQIPDSNLLVWDRGTLGCGLLPAELTLEGGQETTVSPECNDWASRWTPDLDRFQPQVVVLLVGAWDLLDRKVNGQWVRVGTVEYDNLLLSELDRASQLLTSRGARLVVLTTPFFDRPELVGSGRDWPEYEPWRVDRVNALYRDFLARNPGRYTLLDLNEKVSPHGRFADQIDGIQVRGDGVHFTQAGATWVDQWLAPELVKVAQGVAPADATATTTYGTRKTHPE